MKEVRKIAVAVADEGVVAMPLVDAEVLVEVVIV
jgi:hypothetical protein